MKLNTKFDVPVLNYQFEPNDEEYLRQLMKNGITKHAASLMLGNNSIISQPSLMKKFEENQSFTILNERGQKVYFDINEAKISNVDLFEEIGEQILQMRLFGFYNIKLLEIQKNYLTLSLSYLDDNNFVHSSNLLFCTLSSLNYKAVQSIYNNDDPEQQINHALIFNDNLLLKNNYDIKKMLLQHGNVLIDKNKYEYLDDNNEIEIYIGSSFYNSKIFELLIKHGEIGAQISLDQIKAIHDFRLSKNGFDIADSNVIFDFANDKDKYENNQKEKYLSLLNKQIKNDYLQSLFTVTNNEISAYYHEYLLNKSFSEYLDDLIINAQQKKIMFNSFKEFELAFKLSYYKKHNKDYISNDDINEKIEKTSDDKKPETLVEVEHFNDIQTGEEQTGGEQISGEQTGEEQIGEELTGEEQTGKEQTGKEQTGEEQTGEEQTGEEQTGEEQTSEEQTGETQSALNNLYQQIRNQKNNQPEQNNNDKYKI